MVKKVINVGATANDKTGDPLRTAFGKINDNFTELYNLTGVTSLTELAQDYAAAMFTNGTHSGITVTYDDSNNKLNLTVSESNKLVAGSKEVVLTGGANPYVTFPAISTGENIIIQGGEIASSTGAVAITSSDSVVINTNALITTKSWQFGADGSLYFPDSTVQSTAFTGSIDYADVTNTPSIPPNDVDVGGTKYRLIAGDSIELVSSSANYFVRVSEGGVGLTTGTLISGPITLQNAASTGINGSITFPDSTTQITAYTGPVNIFNQSLNTTDAVKFSTAQTNILAPITTGATRYTITAITVETPFTNPYITVAESLAGLVNGERIEITGATTPSQVNGLWYVQYRSVNTFRLYNDSGLTSAPNASGWAAYTGSGIVKNIDAPAAFTITNNSNTLSFNTNGSLTFPDTTVQTTAYPGITTDHSGSARISVGFEIAVRDQLSVRVSNNSNTLDVEVNYQVPGNTVSVSAYRAYPSNVNVYAGRTNKTAGNTTWDNFGNLSGEGDSLSFTFADHSFHKIYRVILIAHAMPGGSAAGEAYCTIEELKNG